MQQVFHMVVKKKEDRGVVDLKPISEMLEEILSDRTVPRNIRSAAEASKAVMDGNGSDELKISTAINNLDEIINDPNMPVYTRTLIWNIVSMLEQAKR
jgi:uncharacterized protein